MPTYRVDNEMSFVHHAVKWKGCGCIVEDDESQDGRTQGHFMPKPKPKLMQAGWE